MPLKSQHYLSNTGKDFKRGCSWGNEERTLEKKPIKDTGRKERDIHQWIVHRSGVAFMEGYMLMLCELRDLRNWWAGPA